MIIYVLDELAKERRGGLPGPKKCIRVHKPLSVRELQGGRHTQRY